MAAWAMGGGALGKLFELPKPLLELFDQHPVALDARLALADVRPQHAGAGAWGLLELLTKLPDFGLELDNKRLVLGDAHPGLFDARIQGCGGQLPGAVGPGQQHPRAEHEGKST